MRSFLEDIHDVGVTFDPMDDASLDDDSSFTTNSDDDETLGHEDHIQHDIDRGNAGHDDDHHLEHPQNDAVIEHHENPQPNDIMNVDMNEMQQQPEDQVINHNADVEDEVEEEDDDDEYRQIINSRYINTAVARADLYERMESHPRASELILRIARSEILYIIRGDIDWTLLKHQLRTYPGLELGDNSGCHLLQSILRNNPPLDMIEEFVHIFPKSFISMDPFYVACQHASDEVVELLINLTIKARLAEGIRWSMLALLGDARLRLKYAKMILELSPQAVADPSHGVFNVSPLDRMISGAFIHGDRKVWMSKLKLALIAADKGVVTEDDGDFPYYHVLIRKLISKTYRGGKFGALTFTNGLSACIESELESSDRHPMTIIDNEGNLPLHVALSSTCDTNLGVTGERKLIKFLIQSNPSSVLQLSSNGETPLRMSIRNGWPVYDIIMSYYPIERLQPYSKSTQNLAIHDILSGKCHTRFGISGARRILRSVLHQSPKAAEISDLNGKLAIHYALEHGWPCYDLIILACPTALELKDATSGLLPFHIAALTGTHKPHNDEIDITLKFQLSILFEVIREAPQLLFGMALSQSKSKREPFDNYESKNKKMKLRLLED